MRLMVQSIVQPMQPMQPLSIAILNAKSNLFFGVVLRPASGTCSGALLFWLVLLFGLLLQFFNSTHAAQPEPADVQHASMVRVTQQQELYRLGTNLALFEDPSGELNLDDIRSPAIAGRFQPSDVQVPNLGFTSSVIWARLELVSSLTHRTTYYLEISNPLLDRISLIIDDGQTLTHYDDTGDRTAFGTRPLNTRMFVFPLELEPSRAVTLYLRFESESGMHLPLLLMSPRHLIEHPAAEYGILSLYYGLLLMLIIYNLHHYIRLRDINALLYVLFIANYIGFQLALNGISFQFLWPDSPWWANANLPFFICTTCLSGTLFTRSILNTARFTPRLHLVLGSLIWISVFGAGLALFVSYQLAIMFAVGLVFTLVIFVITGIRISLMGFRPARYYTLAWILSLAGMAIYALKTYGLLPTNFITTWSTQIGSAWDAVILAFAISDRFYLIQSEKRQIQIAARKALGESKRKLNQLNEELESRVAAGLKELRTANKQLRAEAEERRIAERKADAANRTKSEFLANMSHEIRTPINAVIGFVHLLSCTPLSREQRNYLGKIDQASRMLTSIIKNILDFSKIEAGRMELEPRPFRVETLISKACNLIELSAADKGLNLKVQHNVPQDCCLIGDEGRLLEVLLNLLSNAVKFTESGSVTLRLDCRPHDADQVYLHFCVEDTGIGIAAEQQAGLFQSFTQADSSITRRFGGTGLGLSISQRLVEKMGGSIQISSSVGEGSRFQFTLRFERADVDRPEVDSIVQQELSVHNLEGLRILLVEDQPLNQEIVVGLLHKAGARVVVANNGAEALSRLRDQQDQGSDSYDAVLMDVEMPIMDGYKTARSIRDELGISDLPIIAMTAHALEGEKARCSAAGMNDYIVKPISIERLFRVVRRWHLTVTGNVPEASSLQPGSASRLLDSPSALLTGTLPSELPGIDVTTGLQRAAGDIDLYRRLLSQLYDDHKDYAQRIGDLIAAGKRDEASRMAHELAGTALNLGADEVGYHARALEQYMGNADDRLDAALMALSSSLQILGQAVSKLPDTNQASRGQYLPPDILIDELRELAGLLNEQNLRAQQYLDELLPRVIDSDVRQCLEQANTRIARLDFDAARPAIQALIGRLSASMVNDPRYVKVAAKGAD